MSLRLWTAGLLSAVPALGLGLGQQPLTGAFSLGLPMLVMCGGWLWHRYGQEQFSEGWILLLALLFLTPAILTRGWNEVLAEDLLVYVDPVDHVRVAVGQASRILGGVGPLLIASSLALGLVIGRRGLVLGGAVLGAGLGATAMEWQLQKATQALGDRDGARALELTAWVEGLGLGGLGLGLVLAWTIGRRLPPRRQARRIELLGRVAVLVIVAWQLRPALSPLLLPFPAVAQDGLPQTSPGASVPLPVLDPWAESFMERATARGQSDEPVAWHCSGRDRTRWLDVPRLSVALGVQSDRTLAELDPVIGDLYAKAIHRMVLVGRAETGRGPLSEALSSPGVSFVLAAPPEGSHWLLVGDQREWIWGGEPGGEDTICVLVPSSDLAIGELYQIGSSLLDEGCDSLALLPMPWRAGFVAQQAVDPGCSERGQGPG